MQVGIEQTGGLHEGLHGHDPGYQRMLEEPEGFVILQPEVNVLRKGSSGNQFALFKIQFVHGPDHGEIPRPETDAARGKSRCFLVRFRWFHQGSLDRRKGTGQQDPGLSGRAQK